MLNEKSQKRIPPLKGISLLKGFSFKGGSPFEEDSPLRVSHAVFNFQAFLDYTNSTDPNLLETMMKEITEEITKLWDALMGLEMQLVDQLEVRNKDRRQTNKQTDR